jgi:hypothetical protein
MDETFMMAFRLRKLLTNAHTYESTETALKTIPSCQRKTNYKLLLFSLHANVRKHQRKPSILTKLKVVKIDGLEYLQIS